MYIPPVCVHNPTTTSDKIKASLLSRETVTERVHARRVLNSVFGESPPVQESRFSLFKTIR